MIKWAIYSKYLKEYANFKEIVPGQILYYNAYSYFEGQQLYSKIFKILDKDPNALLQLSNLLNLRILYQNFTHFLVQIMPEPIFEQLFEKVLLESLWIALFVATVEIVIGVFVGAYLGFNAGKMIDYKAMMRIIEIFTSPPSIIWLLLFVSIWGTNFEF